MAGGRSAEDRRADCAGAAAAAAGPAAGGDPHPDHDLGAADYHHIDHYYFHDATASPPPLPFSPATLYDPANYQNFAVLNDGIRFFFDQGAILPDSYGALQVLVPRSAIDPMIA